MKPIRLWRSLKASSAKLKTTHRGEILMKLKDPGNGNFKYYFLINWRILIGESKLLQRFKKCKRNFFLTHFLFSPSTWGGKWKEINSMTAIFKNRTAQLFKATFPRDQNWLSPIRFDFGFTDFSALFNRANRIVSLNKTG